MLFSTHPLNSDRAVIRQRARSRLLAFAENAFARAFKGLPAPLARAVFGSTFDAARLRWPINRSSNLPRAKAISYPLS